MINNTSFPLSDECPQGADKREHKRLPYTTDHKIAPYRGETVPAKEFFFPVTCHDISQGGFSFVIDRLPVLHKIVLSMTVYGQPMYVKARIMNHRKRSDGQFIVGCKFIGRLQ